MDRFGRQQRFLTIKFVINTSTLHILNELESFSGTKFNFSCRCSDDSLSVWTFVYTCFLLMCTTEVTRTNNTEREELQSLQPYQGIEMTTTSSTLCYTIQHVNAFFSEDFSFFDLADASYNV